MKLLVATRNRGKAAEIQALLPGLSPATLDEFAEAPEAEEDAPTFQGNAVKKAVTLALWLSGQERPDRPDFVLADDSGLEVDALAGAPGVYSARFAAGETGAGESGDAANNSKLLRLLAGLPASERTARFRCILAWTAVPLADGATRADVQEQTRCSEGVCEGRIAFEPRGEHGFGYDPLFIPTGYDQSFAELGRAVKNRISHRARALEALRSFLQTEGVRAPDRERCK